MTRNKSAFTLPWEKTPQEITAVRPNFATHVQGAYISPPGMMPCRARHLLIAAARTRTTRPADEFVPVRHRRSERP